MKKWFCLLFAILPACVAGQSINSRLTTSFYTWERNVTDSTSQNHLRIYQTAQLTLGQLASNRLSFHFYGIVSQDVAEDADDDPIPRLYNAYLKWHERKGILQDVKLGRQRIYSGVAYGTIDGVDLTLRIGDRFKVGGFVGMLVPFSNEIEVGKWDDSRAYGFRAGANDIFGTRVLLSFMQRDRRPESYTSPLKQDITGELGLITFESTEQRLAGIDLYRRFGRKVNAYGRLDYDMLRERVRRAHIELKVSATQKIDLTAHVFHRAPLLSDNSIFRVFENSTTQDIGLRGSYRIKPGWFVTGDFGYVQYDGDETVRFGLGVRHQYGSLGYNFRSGYGGRNNGVYATLSYPLTPKIGLLATTGFSRYSLFNEDTDLNTSLTGSVGFNYRANRTFSFDLLGQGVRNRFYDNDFRLFVKANYWFFGKM